MAAVLKTVVLKGTGGSNPSLSASEAALNALLLSLRVRDKIPIVEGSQHSHTDLSTEPVEEFDQRG